MSLYKFRAVMVVIICNFISLYKRIGWCDISELIFDKRFILSLSCLKQFLLVLHMKGYTWYSPDWPVILLCINLLQEAPN